MGTWSRTVAQFFAFVLALTVVKSAIAEPYYVPSGSMEPTLMIGDELVATKYAYGYSSASLALPFGLTLPPTQRIFGELPARGDVVVFRSPANRSEIWVKRVIGLPGDRVQMRDGHLWINGEVVKERADGVAQAEDSDGHHTGAVRLIETLPGGRQHLIFKTEALGPLDNTDEVLVPSGHVFVMGDNRDNSADSRVPPSAGGVGLLPADDIVGRVVGLAGSWDLGKLNDPIWTWPAGLRLSRFFTAVQ
ncbi:signal peptidase I [Pseudorhodoplanes sinuspersici]|uniref:Signal peptidase I n=1 Tax=Pseudorhodoplanes sinuspersici TaxID=1235591 RepID=A0A1W6ZMP1_9HYPH|nr:signal peptidase I [Pseudorhodoplanes sinuspersici]ARP98582.1 signal peptidase I [Pseudorhodoplanes sinuspersici]RKE69840.1 signal peptidase I [Pseudorhodoplanes sinuspersici]